MSGWFHGGVPGLYPGDMIRPPSETGAATQADYGNPVCDRGRVYLTTDLRVAALMAGTYRMRGEQRGDVYEVEPVGDLEPDPDYHGDDERLSVSAERAQILRVVPLREWHPRMLAALPSP